MHRGVANVRFHLHRWFAWALVGALVGARASQAHEVPDRFFDRLIQVQLTRDELRVTYDLSLTELTLAEELLALVGPSGLSGLSSDQWLQRFGTDLGPLLARGLLVELAGRELPLQYVSVRWSTSEGHPRFWFLFRGWLPPLKGPTALRIEETSFFLERGVVRIGIRAEAGVKLSRSSVPADAEAVPVKADWEMSPEEADAQRRAEALLEPEPLSLPKALVEQSKASDQVRGSSSTAGAGSQSLERAMQPSEGSRIVVSLRRLLDAQGHLAVIAALLAAFLAGAGHALTPGHGKTVAAAYVVGQRASWSEAAALGLTTALAHVGTVIFVATVLTLWHPAIDQAVGDSLSLIAGLGVFAVGACLLASRWGALRMRRKPTRRSRVPSRSWSRWSGVVGLGSFAGLVPCWEAVALLLWAVAAGKTAWALLLVFSFSLGLAAVLVGVGLVAALVPDVLGKWLTPGVPQRLTSWLPLAAAAIVAGLGLAMVLQVFRRV
jgi:nickel/cobalt exporter